MKLLTLALLLFSSFWGHTQEAVELIESTLKLGISEEKEFYFGFAEGDKSCFIKEVINSCYCLSNCGYKQVNNIS